MPALDPSDSLPRVPPTTGRGAIALRRVLPQALTAGFVAAILVVHWRALFCFFSADDLVHLQQAAGILPTPHLPWRILTQVLYFRAMLWLFGPAPQLFMLVNLILHCVNTVLFYRLFAPTHTSRASAALAAVLFAACPLFTIVLGHAVIINDISALTCTLAMLHALSSRTRVGNALACIWFLVALGCKESVMFLPLAYLVPLEAGPSPRQRLRSVMPLLLIIAVTVLAFFVARSFAAAPSGGAYVLSSRAVIPNLLTYIAWFASLWKPLPDLVRSLDPHAWVLATPLIAVIILMAGLDTKARPRLLFGAVWLVTGLLPVLPLKNSAYPHYLYVALPGLAVLTSETLRSLFFRLTSTLSHTLRLWQVTAFLLAALYTMQAQALVATRFTLRLEGIDLPLDSQLRSMIVAGRAVLSLAQLPATPHSRLAILSGVGKTEVWGARSGRRYIFPSGVEAGYDLERTILNDGRALRVFYPQLDSVLYTPDWSRELIGSSIAVPLGTGEFRFYGSSRHDQLRLLRDLIAVSASPDSARYADSSHVLVDNPARP